MSSEYWNDGERMKEIKRRQDHITLQKQTVKKIQRKRNPLTHPTVLAKLNPNAVGHKRRQFVANEARQKKKAADLEAKRKGTKIAPTKKEVVKKAVEKKHAASRKKYLAALFAK